MKQQRGLRVASVLTSALVAISLMQIASPSSAATRNPAPGTISPMCVAPDAGYSFSSNPSFIDSSRIYGQKGVTLSLTMTQGTGLTGTVGGELSGDLSAIVAAIKASVSSSIAYSMTSSITQSGSWTVTGATGWFAVGAVSFAGTWQYGSYNCSGVWFVQRSGTYNLPSHMPYFHHS